MFVSVSLMVGEIENLLLFRRPGSGEARCDHLLSSGLSPTDEVSSFSSSLYRMLLSLRIIDFLGLESPTADLHLLETKPPNLRAFNNMSSPNWPCWEDSPAIWNDKGVKLVIGAVMDVLYSKT